jgi:rare lipoprotein A
VPRHRLKVAVWLTLVAVPFLVADNIPRTDANASANVSTAIAPSSVPSTAPSATYPAPTEPPVTSAPPTTAAPAPVAAVAAKKAATPVTAAPTTVVTTTTAPPPTTAAPPTNAQDGSASWYDYRPGECAHQTLPMGTVVRITNLGNGLSTTCVVTDRGPFGAGRVIDLDRATFAQLADPSVGIIQVRITW